jgi:type II secretory pathway component GspD/PulD (secretin)
VKRFVVAVLAVALFAGAARADDVDALKKQLEELRAENARLIDDAHEALKQRLRDLGRIDALVKEKARLEKELEAANEKAGAAPAPPKADADAEVKKRLAQQKVTMSFDDWPLGDVVAFLHDMTGLSIASAVKGKVSLEVNDLAASQMLDLVAKTADDVSWEVRDGIVYLLSKKSPPPVPPKVEIPAEMKEALAKKMTLVFKETPLEHVADFLKDVGGVNVVLTQKVQAKGIKVSLRAHGARISAVLDLMAGLHPVSWRAEAGGVVIDAR